MPFAWDDWMVPVRPSLIQIHTFLTLKQLLPPRACRPHASFRPVERGTNMQRHRQSPLRVPSSPSSARPSRGVATTPVLSCYHKTQALHVKDRSRLCLFVVRQTGHLRRTRNYESAASSLSTARHDTTHTHIRYFTTMASRPISDEDAVAAADKEMEERANRAKELLSQRYVGLKRQQVRAIILRYYNLLLVGLFPACRCFSSSSFVVLIVLLCSCFPNFRKPVKAVRCSWNDK